MGPACPDWKGLQRRLSGAVLLPGTAAYEWARKPFIARFDEIRPQAVARCATTDDVAEVIGFARHWRLAIAARSGGHSLAGHSSTRGIIVDVSPLDAVMVADGVVTVGAGARTGQLSERLFEHGLAIPTGTCPSVGIAGLTLGGGIGILGRAHGLTLDRLVGAEVVLADGSVVECDAGRHPDLFWALRGAGAGNFGVVSAFGFDPVTAPRSANFHLLWSHVDAAAVIDAWQHWSPSAPDALSADLALSASADPDAEPLVEIFGAIIGTSQDASNLLGELAQGVSVAPRRQTCTELSYRDSCAFQAEVSVGYDQVEHGTQGERRLRQGYRFTKSQFFARPLPHDAIAALIRTFVERRRRGQSRSVSFAPWGGAYNRPAPQATAFAHRDQLFSIEHIVIVDPSAPDGAKRAAHAWATSSWDSMRPWSSSAVYPCFPDPDLEGWGRAYYRDNYARLVDVKRAYDPGDLFHFSQSIAMR